MENLIFHSHAHATPIQIRKVWNHNLHIEFNIIRSLISRYPYVSMDTEFPGVIHHPDPSGPIPPHCRSPAEQYHFIKKNVDDLELIQLGLTLMDRDGNLPASPGLNQVSCIWEFNFCDFDPERDPHNPESIEFLKGKGFNFKLNREFGIRSTDFGQHVMRSRMLYTDSVTWVSFHGAYDFAYLVKIILRTNNRNRKLPENLNKFFTTLGNIFGHKVYDIKHVMQFCDGLYGGLERVAATLGVKREVGIGHNAGPDSLLIWRVFEKIRDKHFHKADPKPYVGALYGLVGSKQ